MIAILILLFLTGCVWTETEYEPLPPVQNRQKPHKDFPVDSTQNEDTTRIPIEFNPSVEDWEEIEETL